MNIQVVIEPHERQEAMKAYADWLAPDQVGGFLARFRRRSTVQNNSRT